MCFRFWWPHCHFRLSAIAAITWRHSIRARHGLKSRTCRWNFDAICCCSSYITISGFDSHMAISGRRLMLYSLVDTFCELTLVENSRFAVGIEVIYMSYCRRYKYFRFGWPHCYFRLSVSVAFICGHFLWVWRGRKLYLLRWNYRNIYFRFIRLYQSSTSRSWLEWRSTNSWRCLSQDREAWRELVIACVDLQPAD